MRWRWPELLENVRLGLDRALETGEISSIGVDGWAIDYGLLDEHGRLLSDPHSYRSPRTDGWRAVAQSLGEAELYRRTGVQLMPINTIFQLAAHDRTELDRAARLLMLPELVAYELTGAAVGERSNAGTSGLLDVATGTWASDLAEAVGVSPAILPAVEPAGRLLGEHRGIPVHLVAAHDTACAVAASPLGPADRGFLSAGTWFLVGVERPAADTSETARAANFSNEPGAVGGYRFLKNVPGFWLLERCASEWGDTTARELLEPSRRRRPGRQRLRRARRPLPGTRTHGGRSACRRRAGRRRSTRRGCVVDRAVDRRRRGVGPGRAAVDPPAERARHRRRRCGVTRRRACS